MATRVLFFAPAAEIWEHSYPEALVAEMLAAEGMEVVMARCRGALRPLCPAGQAAGFTIATPIDRQQRLCASCIAKRRLADRAMGLRQVEIDDFVQPGDERVIGDLVRQADALRPQLQRAEDFEQLRVGNQPVGRTALYELILRHKKNDFAFSDSVWQEYIAFLRLAASASLIAERLLQAEKPDRVSVYNSLYVPHRSFCLQARKAGIDQYFMHAGTNLARQHGTLMIGRDFTWGYLVGLVERFELYRNKAVCAAAIEDVTAHFHCLLSSASSLVYSTARSEEHFDVRAHFGIDEAQKFIVASTSSYDERFAVEAVGAASPPAGLLFPRILDWVVYLIELARTQPEWFLLIRVHPREFPNRRDSVQSEHSRLLKALLQDLPANVKVNWPDDNLSLYDLAQEADLFLNAWSSVGKEMALLGLPVVIYAPELVLYPTGINNVGTTREQYLSVIEAAIASGWSFERSRQAHRWFALEFSRSCVDMRASFTPERRYHLSRPEALVLRGLRVLVDSPLERWDLLRRRSMPVAQELVGRLFGQALSSSEQAQDQRLFDGEEREEEAAIRASLAAIGRNLFAANPPDRPSRLERSFAGAGIAAAEEY